MRTFFILAFLISLTSQQASAKEIYIYLDCKGFGENPATRTDDFMVADESGLTFGQDGFTIMGRLTKRLRATSESPNCHYFYYSWRSNPVGSGLPTVSRYSVKRDYNALEYHRADSTTFLNCSKDSILEVFDDKKAWFNAILESLPNDWNYPHQDCLIDKMDD